MTLVLSSILAAVAGYLVGAAVELLRSDRAERHQRAVRRITGRE